MRESFCQDRNHDLGGGKTQDDSETDDGIKGMKKNMQGKKKQPMKQKLPLVENLKLLQSERYGSDLGKVKEKLPLASFQENLQIITKILESASVS